MNIEKEREAFEEWAKANGYHVAKNPIGEVYLSLNCNNAWKAWRAAKAQEVLEGFALVSQKDLLELTIAINAVDLATHTESKTNEVREMWQQVALKSMVLGTTQEQSQ